VSDRLALLVEGANFAGRPLVSLKEFALGANLRGM
jgi:hypothetical protein